MLPREPTDVQDVEGRGISERLIELRDHAFKVRRHAAGVDAHDVERNLQVRRHPASIWQVIRHAFFLPAGQLNREAANVRRLLSSQSHDSA